MRILCDDEIDFVLWDRFSLQSVFHSRKWVSFVSEVYGGRARYMLAMEGEDYSLVAWCAVAGRQISLPYTYASGFLSTSVQIEDALKSALITIGVRVEYRLVEEFDASCPIVASVVSFNSIDDYWKTLSSKMRNQFRRALNNSDYEFVVEEAVEDFYLVYTENMWRLGTPPHSLSFFQQFKQGIPGSLFFVVRFRGEPVAVMGGILANDLLLHVTPTFFNLWAATREKVKGTYANYYLYWKAFEYLDGLGVRCVDLGTSLVGSGVFDFKQKLLANNYSVRDFCVGGDSPLINYRTAPARRLFSRLWQRLPLSFVNWLGPYLRKYLV